MRFPVGTTVKLKTTKWSMGPIRPKMFIVVSLTNKELDDDVEAYVRAWPMFLRLRLWFAMARAKRVLEKTLAFKRNNGI
jgi:hypothetical protein